MIRLSLPQLTGTPPLLSWVVRPFKHRRQFMDLFATAEKRFARLARQYKDRKALAESLVCTWAWATKEVWHLNPLYFEMNAERPGRPFKKKPSAWMSAFSYGADDSGRIVVERRPTESGSYETFYDWSKNSVEAAYFSYDQEKSPINLQLAKYVAGQLAQIATSATGGASLESFHWDGPYVTRIQYHFADRTERGLQKLAHYQLVKATYDSDGSVQRVVIDWLPRPPHVRKLTSEVVFKRRDKPVEIDLRKDAVDVRRMLAAAVVRYASKHAASRSAKQHPPITLIELIFSLADGRASPWVHLCFDTKAEVEFEGGTYTHPGFGTLVRKQWLPAMQSLNDGRRVGVITTDGKKHTIGDGLTRAIGEFLVSTLLSARNDELFKRLPLSGRSQLAVEDPTTDAFGWPRFEDRGKKNLALQKGPAEQDAAADGGA